MSSSPARADELEAVSTDLGRIAPGAVADLVLVEDDPMADIGVLADPSRPRLVLRAGRLVTV